MGSLFSIQSRDKRRRSNRLSKPPANHQPASLSTSSPREPLSPGSPATSTWQNPWTGASIPVARSDSEPNGRRSHSSASVSLRTDPPWVTTSQTKRSISSAREKSDVRIHSPTSSLTTSGTLSRRASFQPPRQPAVQPAFVSRGPPSRWPSAGRPRRSYSVQSPPRRAKSTVNTSSIEEATSSNTHFLVDSQGFSLIRRRSLLTRPGIATRRSTKDAARRFPSPIKQEPAAISATVREAPRPLHWPSQRWQETDWRHPLSLSQLRPPTPNDFEYTHLGALKLGSLRVVNGSTSPCPSDRTRLHGPRSHTPEACHGDAYHLGSRSTLGDHHSSNTTTSVPKSTATPGDYYHYSMVGDAHTSRFDSNFNGSSTTRTHDKTSPGHQCLTRQSECGPSNPLLLAQKLLHDGGCNEQPAYPLSYETPSETVCAVFRDEELQDKGGFSEDQKASISRFGEAIPEALKTTQPTLRKKFDSGYSSATSIQSLGGCAGSSLGSQVAIPPQALRYRRFTFGGNTEDASGRSTEEIPGFEIPCPAHLHPGLRDSKTSYGLAMGKWSTSMCHESLQQPLKGRARSLSYTRGRLSNRMESPPRFCTHLRNQESGPIEMAASLERMDAAGLGTLVAKPGQRPLSDNLAPCSDRYIRGNFYTAPTITDRDHSSRQMDSVVTRTRRAVSETRPKQKSGVELARFYDRANKLGFIDSLVGKDTVTANCSTSQSIKGERCIDTPRGRRRCRSLEYQRRRLSKQQNWSLAY